MPFLSTPQPRATKDLDILIQPDAENGRAVNAALLQFGAPLEGLTSADSLTVGRFSIWGASRWR